MWYIIFRGCYRLHIALIHPFLSVKWKFSYATEIICAVEHNYFLPLHLFIYLF